MFSPSAQKPTGYRLRRCCCVAGFTLIELLVVIAIVGILAALAFPAIGRTLRKSGTSKAMGNARQIYALFGMYAADHNSEWPAPKASDSGPFWSKEALFPYANNGKDATNWSELNNTIFTVPNAAQVGKKDNPAAPAVVNASNRGFGMNALLPSADGEPYQGTHGGNPERRVVRAVLAQNLSKQMLLMECNAPTIYGTTAFLDQFTGFVKNRNDGKNVTMFCDGHVELIDQARFNAQYAQPLMPWHATPGTEASIFWRGY